MPRQGYSDMRTDNLIWTCPVCRIQAHVPIFPVHCACNYVQYCNPPGLGDRVAATLARLGITEHRYVKAKAAVGLRRKCRCPERQQKLNNLFRDNK